jgi:predicted DNA-binding WGR domain protein
MKQLIWISPNRYYIISVQGNLFGEPTVIKSWGGLKSRLGNYAIETFNSLKDALKAIDKLSEVRQKRGYCLQVLTNK